MSYCDRKRQAALILMFVAIMLVGLVVSAHAGTKVNIGDSRDQYERFLARTENLSTESARKLVAYVERTSNARIIDEWELSSGTIIDYYHVGQQKAGGPGAAYNGSAVVVQRNSRLGQAYLREAYGELSFTERVNKWLGDVFAPNNHVVLVPVGMLEPGQMTQMVAAMAGATETRKIAVIGTEFPPWDDHSPDQGTSASRAGFANRYYSAYEVWANGRLTPLSEASVRAYPMYWNLDTNFNGTVDATEAVTAAEYKPDWYADSTGGPVTVYASGRCNPAGLANPAWDGPASTTMPVTPTWYSIETSRQSWTEFQLQDEWWNLIFNRSNTNSLTNYYYDNSHGNITIEGDRSDVTGWVRSGHVLDRHEFGRNWLYAQQPGTPLIRPFLVTPGDPQYDQRIVRASLDEHALTILMAEDEYPGTPELYAYQVDLDGTTTGNQPGYTRIYGEAGASLSADHYSDVYDYRRHQWTNSGWEYRRSSSSSPGYTYVDFDAVYAARGHWYMTAGAYKWGQPSGHPSGGDPVPSGWGTAYPLALNDVGMGFTPWGWSTVYRTPRGGAYLYNTTFTTADVYAQSAADTQAWIAEEGGAGPVPTTQALFGSYNGDGVNYGLGNRLKAFWYYHHDHDWTTGKPTYQLSHLENAAGAVDDIGGTVYDAGRHYPRPYPFNCDGSDSANQGFGFRYGGYGHDANSMVSDIRKVLEDNGIDPNWPGYDSIAYLFPSSATGDDENVGFRMIPRSTAFYVLLPESSGLTLAAHEFGHNLFAFADLYDQDFYNNYMTTMPPDPPLKECLGLGPYSVMTRGCSGVRVDAWHKIGVGWVAPLDITEDRLNVEIPQIEGTLRDPVVLKLPANPYDILKGTAPVSWQEYFLVENRYQVGEDYFGDPSPQGLYIYHVDNRNIRYAPRYQSIFQVEERALSVAMVQADGKMELESYDMQGINPPPALSAYSAGDPFPGADNVRSFSQIPVLLEDSPPDPQRWSPKSWSHGDVISSGPLGTVVIKSGTPTDSFTRVVNISEPSVVMTADAFVEPREIIVTDVSGDAGIAPTLAGGADLTQGDTLQGVLALKLDNPQYPGPGGAGDFSEMSTGEVVVNSIQILESGTAEQNAGEDHPAVERAYLYDETNGTAGLQTTGATPDSRIGTATFGNGGAPDYATFSSLGYRVPPDENRIVYLVYDILQDAQINPEITVGAELTDYTFIIPAAPGAVCVRVRNGAEWDFGAYYFPMVSATSLIIEKPDVLEITPNPPDPGAGTVAPDSISQGASDVPLLQLRMHATDDEVIVKQMTVDATTGVGWIDATDDLNVIRLYVDTNRNGLIDAGTDFLLAEANFADVGGVPRALLQLDDVDPISLRTIPHADEPENDKYWLLSVDVEDEAPVGAQVQIKLLTAGYITLVTNPSHPPAQQDSVSPLNFTEDENGDPLPVPPGTLVKSQASTVIQPNALPNPPEDGFEPADMPPAAPTTFAIISDRTPVFRWDGATDNPTDPGDPATADDPADLYYEIELADDLLMTNIIFSSNTQANPGVTEFTLPPANELDDPADQTVDYYWRLRTVDTDGARSPASVTLHFQLIGNQAPTAPDSGFWPHGSPTPLQITDTTPTYRWDHGTDSDANDTFDTLLYYLQVDDNDDFSSPAVDQNDIPVPALTPDGDPMTDTDRMWFEHPGGQPLTVGVVYYWRVMTKDAQGTYSNHDVLDDPDWSAVSVQQFEVVENRPPYPPEALFSPSNDEEVNTARPAISWNTASPPDPDESDVLDTIDFYVQINDEPNLDEGPYKTELHKTLAAGELPPGQQTVSVTVDVDLDDPEDDTQYWYRVRARDLDGTGLYSDWSAAQSFWVNTQNNTPEPPTSGFSPANGVTINDSTPRFSWNHSDDPDYTDNSTNLHYIVELSKANTSPANFTANVAYQYTGNDGENWLTATEVLEDLTTWYWRVRAVDDSGAMSEWSDIQNFYLDTENQDPVLSEGYPVTEPDRFVNPRYGGLETFYEYRVTYEDAEGDAPGWVRVTIDLGVAGVEQTLPMVAVNPVDPTQSDFQNGVVYAVGIAGTDLGYRTHTWVFFTENSARLPETAPDTGLGPTVGSDSTMLFVDSTWNDTTQYEETGTVYVEIDDQDENLDPTFRESIDVLIYTADLTDRETVTLQERNINDGIFRGEIAIHGALGPANDATSSNGQLNVIAGASGAQIGAYYRDKDDDNNPDPDEQTDTATVVDTEAPARVNSPTSNLTVTSGQHGRSADLDWSGYDETAQIDVSGYSVYYGENDFANTGAADAQLYAQTVAGPQTITVDGLTPNTTYYFAVVGYDEVPNPSAAVPVATEELTTRDTTAPVIDNLSPADGADEVDLDTNISFRMTDPGVGLDLSTLTVEVTVNGTVVTTDIDVIDQTTSTQVDVDPVNDFAWNDTVNVSVSVDDNDGNTGTADWSFDVVADTTDPGVGQQSPADEAAGIAVGSPVTFHLTDDKSGIDLSSLSVTFDGQDITADVTTNPIDGNLDIACRYTPPEDLLYNSSYRVSVSVSDFAGNSFTVAWSFDTAVDDTGVVIDQFSPAESATDVPVDTEISMRMTDTQSGVNVASIDVSASFANGAGGTEQVTGTLDTTEQGNSVFVTFTPQDPLPYSTEIDVDVYVEDNVGVTTAKTYWFITEDELTYIISGFVLTAQSEPVPGVTMTCNGRATTTDGNGAYLLTGMVAGDYTVTPTKDEWTFAPTSQPVTVGVVPGDATDVNFVGALVTYSVSGRVVDRDGDGVAAVAIVCGSSSVQTNASGNYSISGLRRGQYTLTPSLQYYHFEPVNRVAEITDSDVTGQNFTAVPDTFSISGTVYDSAGQRVQGVEVTDGGSVAITSSAGGYTLTNVEMGTHSVSASKVGYKLLPAQLEVTVPPDYTGADFTAYFELSNSFPAGANLIGVPGTPVDSNPVAVFNTTEVARWDPTADPPAYLLAEQHGDTDFMRVRPGSGYFVRFARPADLSIAADPTNASRPVSIGVGVGWNTIANPFAGPTPFANFQPTVAGGIRPYAFVYNTDTGSYDLVSSKPTINAVRDNIQAWEGAWVLCVTGGCSLTITSAATATAAVAEPQQADIGSGYILPVIATASGRSDTCSVAGVIPGAGAEHTLLNPPTAPATVDVYFVNDSGQYLSRDIRDQSSGADSYQFVVSCGVGASDVRVMLPDLSTIPHQYEVMLTDLDAGKTVYARTMQAYTYRSGEGMSLRNFRLEVRPRSVSSLTISTATTVQQSGSAVVTYSVSQRCKVSVMVRNMAGRCVKVLAADKAVSAGLNAETWNLSNQTGAKVPSGPYLIEIRAMADNGQQSRALARINLNR